MEDFRTDRTRYPTRSAYVKPARDRVQRVAREWGLTEALVSDLTLLASELVTNAITHGRVQGREIGVTLTQTPDRVRIEVRDAGDGLPKEQNPTAEDLNGRGLILVGILADEWGVITQVVGKTVFAEIYLKQETPVGCNGVSHA
ncbi:ATP-binding protein [Streptomyces sp. ISL-10]|uniref:ATP-binding protein n=1 Tax=Streptomyces sp. ISL-10 TaxID=2819172 RepID=UPI001BEB8AE4|nr:ATP-binding protein [Streptomyces sp. ISL-10]MBT2365229.1 ATP-binding protein [Streptomyces sp. ISL-10]